MLNNKLLKLRKKKTKQIYEACQNHYALFSCMLGSGFLLSFSKVHQSRNCKNRIKVCSASSGVWRGEVKLLLHEFVSQPLLPQPVKCSWWFVQIPISTSRFMRTRFSATTHTDPQPKTVQPIKLVCVIALFI